MRVLYVSKAMTVATYRDKLRELASLVELRAVVPERWGERPAEASADDEPWLRMVPARMHGHNHLHTYRDPAAWLHGHDLVHIDEEPYSAVTAQLARHCVRAGVPYLYFAWQNIAKTIPLPFTMMRQRVFRTACAGIAGTASAAAVLRGWGYAGPLAVIPQMGVDPQRFRPDVSARNAVRERIGAASEDFVVGFAGRLLPEKGVSLLLRACASIAGSRLVFVGDGPERAGLAAQAAGLGCERRVHFEPNVDSRAMPDWLNAFDVVVLPSLRTRGWMEQFGRVLIEAMACGIAVIGSDSGEIPSVIGDAGCTFAEGDEAGLRDALRSMMAAERRVAAGRRGRCRVEAHYTNRTIAADTVAFYEQVLSQAAA